jgi:hypothetical protein
VKALGGMPHLANAGRRSAQRGQGLFEFALVVPIFLLIIAGMLEFGFAFNHNMTLEFATREGARAGAAMADGSVEDAQCGPSGLTPANVDPLVMAAVQRVLTSPGSMVDMNQISQIRIYEVRNDGAVTGLGNVWLYRPGNPANPAVPCQSPTQLLDFFPASATWPAASRTLTSGTPPVWSPDSIGVSITYTYRFRTPLGGLMRFIGGSGMTSVPITDRAVMALQPTS